MTPGRITAVVDTNIFVQAFLNPAGPSGIAWKFAREELFQLVVSVDLLDD